MIEEDKLDMAPKKKTLSIDYIPEELLVKTISFLDFKEAVRTSVISRRWRHLWKYIPNIVIDDCNVLSLVKVEKRRANGVSTKIIKEFIDVANFILQSHRGSLESLVIRFFFEGNYEIYLNEWISCAISSRAKQLVLDLQSPYKIQYDFPFHLLSSEECFIEFLELKFCSLKLPIQSFDGLKNLTTLQLKLVHVTDKIIQDLLPKCVALKVLSLISCNQLLDLKFPISVSKLEVLHISLCKNLKSLESYAPELSNFTYASNLGDDQVSLKIKVLEKAFILSDSSYVMDHLPQAIASVKTLKLMIKWSHKVPNMPHFQDKFVNLKQLVLLYSYKTDIGTLSTVLNASPFLESLVVRIFGAIFEEEESINAETMSNCSHNYLKSAAIDGFTGYNSQLLLVRFLLTNATQLEIMAIQTSTRYSTSGSKLKLSPLKIELERKIFYEHLRPQAPQHVKLLVL